MSQEDRLADVRQALDEAAPDPEEQRQLLAVADGLTRHYQVRRRGRWVFTVGAVAAAVGIMAVGAYTVLGRIHTPAAKGAASGVGVPAVVTSQVPYVYEVPSPKLAAAYRPALPQAEFVVLVADKLANGETAVLEWDPTMPSTAPVEEVVVSKVSDMFFVPGYAPSFAVGPINAPNLFGKIGVTGRVVWGGVMSDLARGTVPAISFVALPSGSFPGLPLIPIRYAPGVPHLTGGRLVLVKVSGVSPAYWLINTDGQVVAAGSTLAEPLSSYGTVQKGLPALEHLLGF